MDLAFWRDMAIVFLAIESVVLLTVLVVAFYFAVRGLNIAHTRLPRLLLRAQDMSRLVRDRTQSTSERIGTPLVRVQHGVTRTETTVRQLLPGARRKPRQ